MGAMQNLYIQFIYLNVSDVFFLSHLLVCTAWLEFKRLLMIADLILISEQTTNLNLLVKYKVVAADYLKK